MSLLPVGTKIIFTREIVEEANGDHPEFLLAKEGQTGEIMQHYDIGDMVYSVRTSPNAGQFGVKINEVRAAQ